MGNWVRWSIRPTAKKLLVPTYTEIAALAPYMRGYEGCSVTPRKFT